MMRVLSSFVVYHLIPMCSAQTPDSIDFTPAKNDSLPSLTNDAHMSTTTSKPAPFTCQYEMVQKLCRGPEHKCIFIYDLCNNRRDCPLGDDEDDCSDRSDYYDRVDEDKYKEKKSGWQPWHIALVVSLLLLSCLSVYLRHKFYRPCCESGFNSQGGIFSVSQPRNDSPVHIPAHTRPGIASPSAPPQTISTTVTITTHQEERRLLFGEPGDRQPPPQQSPSVNNDPQSTDSIAPPPSYSEAIGMGKF